MSARTITITSVSQIRKGDRVVSEGDYHIPTANSPWTVERSAPEHEPGTFGAATVRGELKHGFVVRTSHGTAFRFYENGGTDRTDKVPDDFVPDPDPAALRAEVERLTRELAGIGCSRFTCADDLTRLRAEVERLQGELYSERNAVETMVGLRKGVADWAAMQKARADAAEARLARVKALFAGGPDTPCRTKTYEEGGGQVDYVEVPLADLHLALVAADEQAAEGEAATVTREQVAEAIRGEAGDAREFLLAYGVTGDRIIVSSDVYCINLPEAAHRLHALLTGGQS